MALKLVTGGTEGAADGTLVSSDGSYSNPVVVTTPYTVLHMRCDDGYWSDDQEFDLPAALPDGVTLEVSFNEGTDWVELSEVSPETAPEIEDVNFPVWVRQTGEAEADELESGIRTDGTYTAVTTLTTPTLTATAVDEDQIDLSWTNVANEDGYLLEWSPNGSSGWATVEQTVANDTTTSHTGLDPDTQYFYRVKALGSGRYSDSGYGTDDATTDAAADVSGFAVTSISGTTVNLGWSAFGGANHYKIERATDSGFTANLTTVSDAATGTSYADSTASADTTYYYRITAHDASHGALSGSGATCYAGVQVLVNPFASRGRVVRCTHGTWATARSGGGTLAAFTLDNSNGFGLYTTLDTGTYYVDRGYQDFDGAAIPAGATIDAADVRVTLKENFGGTGFSIHKGSWTENPPDTGSFTDFDATDLGGPSSWPSNNTPTWYAISTPDANITKAGVTRLAFRERTGDHANSAPANGTDTGGTLASYGDSTSGYRPQLRVSFHG